MRRMNVLLVVLDAVRADHLSCYGYGRPTTPGLERLAGEGVLFERAFTTAPWTPPSHASLFTGTFPSRHGVDVGENLTLGKHNRTLAEILSAKGYATFAVLPDAHLSEARGFHRGFSEFVEMFRLPYLSPNRESALSLAYNLLWGRDARAYHSSLLLKKWIGRHVRSSDRPFFAFVNYKTAHNSYHSPHPFRGRFERRPQAGQDIRKLRYYTQRGGYPYMTGQFEMSAEDMEVVRSWYDGAVAYLDACVEDLLGFLRQIGVYDHTLVIVAADHGESFGERGLAYHLFALYDTLIHVPLLMTVPGFRGQGRRVEGLVSLVDVLPTVLELVGGDASEYPEVEGRSLVPFDGATGHPRIFAEFGRPHYRVDRLAVQFPGDDFSKYDRGLRCIRTADVKLIVCSDGQEELYDLLADPGETRNVIRERGVEADKRRRELEEWLALFKPVPSEGQDDDEVARTTLEELGYL